MSVTSTDPGNRNSGISQPETIPENTPQTDQTETGNVRGNQFTPADRTAPARRNFFRGKLPGFKSLKVFSKFTKSSLRAQPGFKAAVNKLMDLNKGMPKKDAVSVVRHRVQDQEELGIMAKDSLADLNRHLGDLINQNQNAVDKLKSLHPGMSEEAAVSVIKHRVQDRVNNKAETEPTALEKINKQLDGRAKMRLEIETIRDRLAGHDGFRRIYTRLVEQNETMLTAEAKIRAATAIHEKLNEVPADMPLDAILDAVYQDVLTENDPAPEPPNGIYRLIGNRFLQVDPRDAQPPEADDDQRPTPPDQFEGQGDSSWQSNENRDLPVFKGFSRSEPNLGSEQFLLQPIPARSTLQSTSNEQDLDPNIGRPLPEMSLSGRDASQRESEQLEAPDAPPTTMEGEFWDDPEVAAAVAESDAALAESFEKAEHLDDLFEAFPPDTTGVKF